MKIYFLFVLSAAFLVIIFVSCSETLAPVQSGTSADSPANAIRIEQLEAHNISENMSFLSTQNDEILLLTYLMEKQPNGVKIIEEKMFNNMIFDSTTTIHYLDHSFFPSKENSVNSIATFVLVELDKTDSETAIQDKFRAELVNGNFLKEIEREKLDSMIGDDDFLGLKFLEFKDLKKGKTADVVISGMYLFDRYKYTLHCKGL